MPKKRIVVGGVKFFVYLFIFFWSICTLPVVVPVLPSIMTA